MKWTQFFIHCLVILTGTTTVVSAQQKTSYAKWQLQVTAGSCINYFTDEQPHRSVTVGYNTQALVNFSLPRHWSFFAEVGMAGAGGGLTSFRDDTYLGFDPTISFKYTKQSSYVIHALESAIGVGYSLRTRQGWKIKLYTAPALAITMGEWEKYEKTGYLMVPKRDGTPGVVGTIENRQYVDVFEPYWFSIMGGLQTELPFKQGAFLVDFRFVNGITPVRYDYSYLNTPGIQGNIRTNSFRASLGYTIPAFGKKAKSSVKK